MLEKKTETAPNLNDPVESIAQCNAYEEWLLFDKLSDDEGQRDSLTTGVGSNGPGITDCHWNDGLTD